MEHLIFALNATVPVFLLVLLGMAFRKTGVLARDFADKINQFVFNVSLPAVLWRDLSGADFLEVWDGKFIGFCFGATITSILIAMSVSLILKDRGIRGEFIQASYRSSAALLGIAFVHNIYGSSSMAPLMIIGCVPLYNIMAVVILEMMRAGRGRIDRRLLAKTMAGILHNPIIWGIICGMAWSALGMPRPSILVKVVSDVAVLATPLGLLAMGALFDRGRAGRRMGPALLASFIKLAGLSLVIVPAAIAAGFRREALTSIFIMLGSATTFGSFVMAKNMGYDGDLTSNTVMITTCGCALTLTIGLYVLKSLNLI